MIRRPPRSTQSRSSAASDVYKRQAEGGHGGSHISGDAVAFEGAETPDPGSLGGGKFRVRPTLSQARSAHPAVRRALQGQEERREVLRATGGVVSVDRLKPAFGFVDPESGRHGPPAAARPPVRGRPPRTLNPEAEEFSPAVTRSRFGRVSRPPVRLGL